MISRLVILGGSGFLGGVARRHAEAAGLRTHAYGSKDVDLLKESSLEAIRDKVDGETGILVASAVTPDVADDAAALSANLEMARNAARFFARRRPGLVLYLSSVSVYGRSSTNLAITEETPVDLDSNYARAKFEGEEIFRHAGLPLAVLRVCQVYGRADTHGSYGPTRFIRGILRERKVTLFGEGEDRRDHLFGEDAGRFIVRAVRERAEGVFNLATGTSHSFAEVLACLRRIAPAGFDVTRTPRSVPLVHQGFDIARLKARFPEESFTPLETGLRETWEALSGP